MLDLPKEVIDSLHAQDIDVQWVVDSVLGKPEPQSRMAFEINGWERVTGQMFKGIFDGMLCQKGYQGEITYDGLVLMWRPDGIDRRGQGRRACSPEGADRSPAQHDQGRPTWAGFSASFEPDHPTALARNRVERSIEIPTD